LVRHLQDDEPSACQGIVEATTHFRDANIVAKVSTVSVTQ